MEFHYERFVKQKITKGKKIFVIFSFIALLIAITLTAIIVHFAFDLPLVAIILMCAMSWLFYLYLTRLAVEYEYQLTCTVSSLELDIAKIVSQKKRKELLSLNCKEFEMVARVNGPKDNDSYRTIPIKYKCVKTMEEEDVFFIITNTEQGRTLIYVQLNAEMLDGLKKNIPSKVFC